MNSLEIRPAVAVKDLTVSFSKWGQAMAALRTVSLDIPTGQWLLLAGPNGAGKSTLLKAIAGRLRPDSGEVQIHGQQLNGLQVAAAVFLVQQDPLLGTAPLLTVFENLLVADPEAEQLRSRRSKLVDRYTNRLAHIGLADRLKQPVKLLSGGERQLLAMVIAGLRKVTVILLDEPFAALSPANTELCIQEVRRMYADGKTIVHVAHDVQLLSRHADRVVTLDKGCIVADMSLHAIAGGMPP